MRARSEGEGATGILPILILVAAVVTGQATAGAQEGSLLSGTWQAIDFSTSADEPDWQDRPEVLQQTFGQELSLSDEMFRFLDIGCGDPVQSGLVMAVDDFLISLAGATQPLMNYFGDLDGSVEIVEIDCLETGEVAMALTETGMLILPYFGGYLIFDAIPSERVRLVQQRLGALGFSAGGADGVYGARTGAAIQQLQERLGIPPTGAVSPFLVSILSRTDQ